MELGIYTFVENTPDSTGHQLTAAERTRNLLEEMELADQAGLDVFGIGEHHRSEYLASAPAVLLAAGAARTKKIRLTSAVTVLSSDDPVRVFQDFATLDLISDGRAEIIVGRGSFIESYPLFGQSLNDYDSLFANHLDLLLKLRTQEHVQWQGKHRAPLTGQAVYPRPVQPELPIWIGVGGTPQSFARAGTLGLPLAIAIIGGQPAPFKPLVELYREAGRRAGHDPAKLRVSINSHGYLADSPKQARDEWFPAYQLTMNRIGRERGWQPTTRAQYDAGCMPLGALVTGSHAEVTDKILYEHSLFGNDRFLLQFSLATMPHRQMMHAIELYGTYVAPAVRKALSKAD